MFLQVEVFKVARLFDPPKICQLRPIANDINVFASVVFLNYPNVIKELKEQDWSRLGWILFIGGKQMRLHVLPLVFSCKMVWYFSLCEQHLKEGSLSLQCCLDISRVWPCKTILNAP